MSDPIQETISSEADSVSRLDFLKIGGALAASAGAVATTVAQSTHARATSANAKIRIGFIGPGGRGFGAHVKTLSKLAIDGQPVELVSVCDIYREHRDRAADFIHDKNGNTPTKYEDFREMIAKEKLDAVCIVTPDHWHAKQAIECLESGLDARYYEGVSLCPSLAKLKQGWHAQRL